MTRRECEECGFSTTTPEPNEVFWIGDKPPFSDFNYCPRCGNKLTITEITRDKDDIFWVDDDEDFDEKQNYYKSSISGSSDGLFREDD